MTSLFLLRTIAFSLVLAHASTAESDFVPISDEDFEVDITPPPKDIDDAGSALKVQSIRDDVNNDVLALNRWTFEGNVKFSETVDNWVVFFCVDWYAPCQLLWPHFKELAIEWQERQVFTTDPLRSKVRFASVDCTVDKVLCNTEHAWGYPWIKHYRGESNSTGPTSARSLTQAVKQVRSWLALRLLDKPPVEAILEFDEAYDPWTFSGFARFSGLSILMRDDMIDICLLLTACAAAAGLYMTRGAGESMLCVKTPGLVETPLVSTLGVPAVTMRVRTTAELLPHEWSSQRQEITL